MRKVLACSCIRSLDAEPGDLGQRVDQPRDLAAEALLHLGEGDLRVLDHVVEEGGGEEGLVDARLEQLDEDEPDLDAVGDVGIARAPELIAVRGLREIIGAPEPIDIEPGAHRLHLGDEPGKEDVGVAVRVRQCARHAVSFEWTSTGLPGRDAGRGAGPRVQRESGRAETAVSRVLSDLAVRGGHLSGTPVAGRLEQPTRESWRDGPPLLPYLALLRVGFTELPASPPALVSSYLTVSPLPAPPRRGVGGLFSVALSLGSLPLGVTQHPARWSPDFPRIRGLSPRTRGHLADSGPTCFILTGRGIHLPSL